MNPQTFNRYSYVWNNPVRFNDPSGHCVGNCGFTADDFGKVSYSSPQKQQAPVPEIFQVSTGMAGLTTVNVAFMPPGTSPSVGDGEFAGIDFSGIDPGRMGELSMFLDLNEALLSWTSAYAAFSGVGLPAVPVLQGLELVVAAGDAGVTFAGCVAAGECYDFISPHPALPEMVVFNQDVLINGVEVFIPGGFSSDAAIKNALNTASSLINSFYDAARTGGSIPNTVSVGITTDLYPQTYILIYTGNGEDG